LKRGLYLTTVLAALASTVIACNMKFEPPTPPATPTAVISPTPPPTITLTPSLTPPIGPTRTGTIPPLTLTPSLTPSSTPAQPIRAKTCDTCQPNLRESPGTAGRILRRIPVSTPLTIIGRTAESTWSQVLLDGGSGGWIATSFIDLGGADITSMPITGTAVDSTLTPTYAIGSPRVISGITAKSREIFVKGQKLGNRADIFTRVGDSLTATPMFLTPFGSGQYDLGSYSNQLSDVVSYFGGSFGKGSMAAGNGWGADRILQPGFVNPGLCGNDSPLVCEYRHTKPAVALILIGTNDAGGVDAVVYAGQLRQIVQTSIDMGVIPVLTTLPAKKIDAWNNARIDEFNGIIRSTARQFDVPLLDYWYSLKDLPNQGLSSDGVHPSAPAGGTTGVFTDANLKFGYTMRNLTALQMLDALWHTVLY
jgi:hypothetical protein